MTKKNFKIKIVLTFAAMLIMAMLLQSFVIMFLGVRSSIREDVAWAKENLILEANFLSVGADRRVMPDVKQDLEVFVRPKDEENAMFSSFYLKQAGEEPTETSTSRFTDKLRNLSQQAEIKKKTVIGFAGTGWNTFLIRSEVVLIAVPLVNGYGEVVGSIAAERSLLPIYSRYEQNVKIMFCYLLVNTIIFSVLVFFRISHHFFKPLDTLVQKAEAYQPDEQTFFMLNDSQSPFRKLSTSLSALLERIEKDNHTLRKYVAELEDVNAELKEKNNLIVRSEKLATAGRLSAGLAHEIGNPLTIIQGYVELLSRDDLNIGEKRKFSERAQLELGRIKRLIKQLLEFSGPTRSMDDTVSINTLIADVISFVSMAKTSVECSINTKNLAEDDIIVTDKDSLRQVLINCLFNAIDATGSMSADAREIIITTFRDQRSPLGSMLVVSVKDNGPGIAKEHLDLIFDPFFTTKEVGRGTGLGLFVCHTIMERLAGAIYLSNRSPNGVDVRIELPLRKRKFKYNE